MSQAQTSYEEILQKSWAELPEAKMLPDGSYRLRCTGAKVMPPKQADHSAQALFVYEPQEPMDDVNADALAALGADYDFSENVIYARFWLSKASDWDKVRKHLAKHGINPTDFDSVDASLKAVKNTELIGYVVARTFADKSGAVQQENVVQTFIELN